MSWGWGISSGLSTHAAKAQCGGVPPAVEQKAPKTEQSPLAHDESTTMSPSQCGSQAARVQWGPTPKSPQVNPKAPQSPTVQSL